MTASLVSVVIPSYNAAAFLAEAIESVLAQTYRPHQLIVVDDGSTDETVSVAERYADSLHLVRLPHVGYPGGVRNRGIEQAHGDFLAFLDADDTWMPDKLEIQVDLLLARPDLGLVHSNLEVIDAHGRFLRDVFLNVAGSRGLSDDYEESSFTQLLKGESGIWTSSVLLRRECVERVGNFDESLAVAEDWDLWIRIARTFKIGYVSRTLARHRCHPTNTGRHWIPQTIPPEIQLWSKVLRLYPEIEPEWGDLIRAKCALHYVLNAIRCVQRGYYRRAAALAAQLARIDFGKTGFRRFGVLLVRFLHRQCLQKGREILGTAARLR